MTIFPLGVYFVVLAIRMHAPLGQIFDLEYLIVLIKFFLLTWHAPSGIACE